MTAKTITCLAALSLVPAALGQQIAVTIDNEPIRFSGVGPRSIEGRVLVPLRGVFEALGAYVEWVPSRRAVIANKGDVDMELRIGERVARVNGRDVLLDVPAMVYSGSTMVPLRFVGETLGAEVDWNASTRTVEIMTGARQVTDSRQTRTTTGGVQPEITSFNVTGEGWLRGNQDLEVVLIGTPGGRATFEIPGVTSREIAMREVSPGRYVGTWRPTGNVSSISGAAILGRLEINGRDRLIQAGRNLAIDTTSPTIRNVIPDRSRITNPRPTIAVVLDDQGGSGIDEASVQLVVNGQNVTRDAEVTGSFVSYVPRQNLPAGENRVELSAQDRAGNRVSGAWTFTVTDARDIVQSLTHNGNERLEPGDVFTVRLQGEPGGTATFSIGSVVTDRPMRESSPGVYVGEYTIRRGDRFVNAPVTATLTTRGGQSYNIQANQNLAFNAGVLSSPNFSNLQENQVVEGPLVITGTGEPNSRVRVRVEYEGTALGILRLTGTAYDRILVTDAQGRFTTGQINLGSAASASGTVYTIRAVPLDANGNEGQESVIRVRRR